MGSIHAISKRFQWASIFSAVVLAALHKFKYCTEASDLPPPRGTTLRTSDADTVIPEVTHPTQ